MGLFSKIKNLFNKEIEEDKKKTSIEENTSDEVTKEEIDDELEEISNDESNNDIVSDNEVVDNENIDEDIHDKEDVKSEKEDKKEKNDKHNEVKEIEKYVDGLSKSRENFVSKLSLLGIKYTKISNEFYDELEEILITADIGVNTVIDFVDRLKDRVKHENITDFEYLKEVIVDELFMIYVGDDVLSSKLNIKDGETNVVLFVGVNGVGKTTSIAKIANKYKNEGKKVMLVAGDTFRAGAVNQLKEWADRLNVSFYGDDRKDPSAVIYDGVSKAKNEHYDLVLVDTAGRLQNKTNLMKELEKMNRVIGEILPGNPVETLLVIDATTGQNGIAQAKSFKEIIALCLIIFAGSIAITSAILNANSVKDVQIPKLVGMTEAEAKAELAKYKLVYEKSGEDYNSEVEAGKVFEQNPVYSDNYKVKEKSTVSVKISKGTEQTTVPKVAGMTYEEAVDALEKNKLKAEKIEETSKTIKEGIVISQETDANTTANAGDTVKIHVSIGTGVNQVVMPNVLGKTEADAKSALGAKNLVVKVEYKENTDKENGEVLEQSIKSGENIDEGTEVTITVNKLAEMKEATITINVKSLTGGYEVPDKENTNTTNTTGSSSSTTVKEKKLTVKVGEDKVYDKKVDLNSTNIQTKISGKGTVTVKVYVDDILKSQKDINLNTTSSYTFE